MVDVSAKKIAKGKYIKRKLISHHEFNNVCLSLSQIQEEAQLMNMTIKMIFHTNN